jgi:uncharacterized protein (DUF433 family)
MLPTDGVIVRDLDILGGTAVFRGTRVPFKNLLDYLEGGHTLDEFLEEFPSVTREAALREERMLGANGFEPSTSWSATRRSSDFVRCKSLILKEWSGRMDLNHRPPGPEPDSGIV